MIHPGTPWGSLSWTVDPVSRQATAACHFQCNACNEPGHRPSCAATPLHVITGRAKNNPSERKGKQPLIAQDPQTLSPSQATKQRCCHLAISIAIGLLMVSQTFRPQLGNVRIAARCSRLGSSLWFSCRPPPCLIKHPCLPMSLLGPQTRTLGEGFSSSAGDPFGLWHANPATLPARSWGGER